LVDAPSPLLEQIDLWAQELGSAGYLVLGLAALLEYLVPPFPGDTVMVAGGAYAVRGEKSVLLVFLAVTLGSVLGLSAMYLVGRAVGTRVDRQPEGRLFLGVTHAQIRKLQEAMRDRGTWLLIANRFLPTFRSVLFIAAGAARMPFVRVVTLGALSAMAWNLLLVAVGFAVGGKAERLVELFKHYNRISWVFLAVVLVAVAVRFVRRRRTP
jgi:membrane protein DedA with SNARE-associated domain